MWVKKENLLEMIFLPNQDLYPSALHATMLLGKATDWAGLRNFWRQPLNTKSTLNKG